MDLGLPWTPLCGRRKRPLVRRWTWATNNIVPTRWRLHRFPSPADHSKNPSYLGAKNLVFLSRCNKQQRLEQNGLCRTQTMKKIVIVLSNSNRLAGTVLKISSGIGLHGTGGRLSSSSTCRVSSLSGATRDPSSAWRAEISPC